MPVWMWGLGYAVAGVIMLVQGGVYLYFGPERNDRVNILWYYFPGLMVLTLDLVFWLVYLIAGH